jgi:predicted lipid-binding transport protein (Tim44 family)
MADGAGAPPSPIDGSWTHSDEPAITAVRGAVFQGPPPSGPPPVSGPVPGMPPPPAGSAPVDDPERGLAAIRAKDPGFDKDGFLGQVQRAFFIVEEAWTSRRPEMSRQVMADGLWQQHRFQIEGYQSGHKRCVLDELQLLSIAVMAVHTDEQYDTITTRLLASSSDYDVDENSGKVVRGDRDVAQWAEDWTFQRAASARTPAAGGTFSDRCPNCGAPLQLDFSGICTYCKALVSTGTYDWVLSRISRVPPAY